MADYKLYTVEREGKTVKLKFIVQILSKIFGLFPETILLLSDDGYVETADAEGRFHDVDYLPHWSVSGNSLKASAAPSSSLTQFDSAAAGQFGLNPFSYQMQPPTYTVSKRGRGKTRWMPQFSTSLLGQRRKPPGVRAQEEESREMASPANEYAVPAPPQEWR